MLGPDERFASWRVVLRDGSLVGFGRGGIAVLEEMRRTRWLARSLALLPSRVLEVLYELVARHRSRLGRLVPDRPGPRRYP